MLQPMRSQRAGHDWAIEQQQWLVNLTIKYLLDTCGDSSGLILGYLPINPT